MSFILPNGNFNLAQLNQMLVQNNGSHMALANQNTAEARSFQKLLHNLSQLRNDVAQRANADGSLPSLEQARVRAAAAGISQARLAAQRSQMRTDSTATTDSQTQTQTQTTDPNDPYVQTNGLRYREGPGAYDVTNGGRQFREGDKGEGVKHLQQQLLDAGYDLGPKGADGFFGPKTAAAAKAFFEKYPDLDNTFDGRAVLRARAAAEGERSSHGTGIDAR